MLQGPVLTVLAAFSTAKYLEILSKVFGTAMAAKPPSPAAGEQLSAWERRKAYSENVQRQNMTIRLNTSKPRRQPAGQRSEGAPPAKKVRLEEASLNSGASGASFRASWLDTASRRSKPCGTGARALTEPLPRDKVETKVNARPRGAFAKVSSAATRPLQMKKAENKAKAVGVTPSKQNALKKANAPVSKGLNLPSSGAPKRQALSSDSQTTRKKGIVRESELVDGKENSPPRRSATLTPKQQAMQSKTTRKPAVISLIDAKFKSATKASMSKSTKKKQRPSNASLAANAVVKSPAEDKPSPTVVSEEQPLDRAADMDIGNILEEHCRTPEAKGHASAAVSSMFNNMGSAGRTPLQFARGVRRLDVGTPCNQQVRRAPLRTLSPGYSLDIVADITDSQDRLGSDDYDKVALPPLNHEKRDLLMAASQSCLRKRNRGQGSALLKKSVSFSIPGTRDGRSPAELFKTPQRARTVMCGVSARLQAIVGSSVSKLRHSHCFVEHSPVTTPRMRAARKSISRNSGQRSVKMAATTSPVATTSKSTDDASEGDASPSSPASVLKLLRDHVTKDKEELRLMIGGELDEQVSVTENVVPEETRLNATQQRPLPRELFNIALDSVFSSTVIKYKVYEIKHSCTSSTTAPCGSKPTPKIVMTPVRRSSRHASQRHDDLVPPGVLYKPNPAIGDLD